MKGRSVIYSFSALVLFVAGFLVLNQAKHPDTPGEAVTRIQHNLLETLARMDNVAEKQLGELRKNNQLSSSSYVFVVLQNGEVTHWTDNRFIPSSRALSEDFELKYIKTGYGDVLVRRWRIDDLKVLVGILPLHIRYKISNTYLKESWNEEIFESNEVVIADPEVGVGERVELNGSPVFRVLLTESGVKSETPGMWLGFGLILLGLSLLVLGAKSVCSTVFTRYPLSGFIALTLVVVGVRVIMIISEFPASFLNTAVFDPKNFASSYLNPSLGDLFLNSLAVFILCLYLFVNYSRFKIFYSSQKSIGYYVLLIVSGVAFLFGILFPFVVIQTIYNNSLITLSISESINFDFLRVLAFISIALSWVNLFLFAHVFIRFLALEKDLTRLIFVMSLATLIFSAVNLLTGQAFVGSLIAAIVYLAIVKVFKFHKSLYRFSTKTVGYTFLFVVTIAAVSAMATRVFEKQRSVKQQFSFAGNYLGERDYFVEYLLQEAADKIASDAFIQARLVSPFLSREAARQKIVQIILSGYFNRYTTNVSFFNGRGEPLDNDDDLVLAAWAQRYDSLVNKTVYKNVFFVPDSARQNADRYISLVSVKREGITVGYVAIELTLKRVIPVDVYPELLVDNRFQRVQQPQSFSYAVFSGDNLLFSTGDFNYGRIGDHYFAGNQLFTTGITKDNFVHVGVEDVNGRLLIVSAPVQSLRSFIGEFSFFVLVGMGITLLLLIAQWMAIFFKSQNLSFTLRIQLMLNLAFFVPLIIVSVITLGLTSNSAREQLEEEYLSKVKRMSSLVAQTLSSASLQSDEELSSVISDLAFSANVDATIFSTEGKLSATSQPLIFENNILSPVINPDALARIAQGENSFIESEKIGTLDISVAYAALLSPDSGEKIGILGIPFFQSSKSIEQLQITVFGNILSIFIIIFILFLGISFLVTEWLTSPLSIITRQLGLISLTKINKPLEWKSNDEIGLMVQEYNQMLTKLEQSKVDLEKAQREQAWREIAQQVAHEIKNPLTPMKLTLQQLEKAGITDQDKLNKVVTSLLTQVNTLNDIATSFSSLAKMPQPTVVSLDVVQLLTKIIALYHQEAQISLKSDRSAVFVLGDSQLLGRVFSNLILNGIQAARPDVPPQISIQIQVINSVCVISFSDNGRGIEDNIRDKIFLPHFTTKQFGSGLGLAIARQGIQQMGGIIEFETTPEGSIFYVKLKIAEK